MGLDLTQYNLAKAICLGRLLVGKQRDLVFYWCQDGGLGLLEDGMLYDSKEGALGPDKEFHESQEKMMLSRGGVTVVMEEN